MQKYSNISQESRKRNGVAAVEFAVTAPVLVIVVFGAIHATHQISLAHSAKMISHSAATAVLQTSDTFAAIESRHETLATNSGITGLDVRLSRFRPEIVEIEVEYSLANNSLDLFSIASSDPVTITSYVYRPSAVLD